MKTNKVSILLMTLITLPLCGCNPESEVDVIKTAVNSLRETSHKVNVKQTVSVLRPIPEGMTPEDPNWMYLPVDIHHEYNNNFKYYYGEDGERAYSREFNAKYCDLDKLTGEPISNSIRYNNSQEEIFFKDKNDGTIYSEEITIENEYKSYSSAKYNEETGLYSKVVFDTEFINPFDYISYRDITFKSDDKSKLTLLNEKADYLAECYGTVGLNFISENTINLDKDGNITSIDFVINDLVDDAYTRKNTMSISYDRNNATIEHYKEFDRDNSELQKALDVLDGKKNFTYIKEFISPVQDTVVGYFTEEEVYFHHQVSENDTQPYTKGDDYDYKCVLQDDETYLCYEFVPNGENFKWGVAQVSGTSDYIIDSFKDIGPSFMKMNASIFKKVDEKTYKIEKIFLPFVGVYFDNGMLGVQSGAFESNTTDVIIKLNDEGMIDYIQADFVFEMVEYNIKFYIKDIGTTVIPEWAATDLVYPVPEYNG